MYIIFSIYAEFLIAHLFLFDNRHSFKNARISAGAKERSKCSRKDFLGSPRTHAIYELNMCARLQVYSNMRASQCVVLKQDEIVCMLRK